MRENQAPASAEESTPSTSKTESSTQNPTTKITYEYYSQVFQQDFPKLKFKCLASDTCEKFDVYKVQIQAAVTENAKNEIKVKQELHHRKSEKAQAWMKEDMVASNFK
ncbi:hypothetical protein WA026_006737 [Henosepilachna vigintioctopunctata]|uniref:Uncharacterized protein n=1 Tax=Henosepilachna vigintioctopunctata TaxID=420089 RepID=A0AAW1UIX9_9CUCU